MFSSPFILLFTFLLASTGIVVLSFLFAEAIKNIMDRFKLSEHFIGSSLLATGTSLPEAINAVTAGVYDRTGGNGNSFTYSLNSLYNLTGAISVQIVFLSSAALLIWRLSKKRKAALLEYRSFTSSIFRNKGTLWSIYTVELSALILFFVFSSFAQKLSISNFNLVTLSFFIVWLSYLFSMRRSSKNTEEEPQVANYTNIFQRYENRSFLLFFILIFISFVLLAFLNFNLVSKFEEVFKIPKNIGLGTILSLVTSFPEFSSFFFLYKSRCYSTACAGFFGSALFNLMLPFFSQLIQGKWLFSTLSSNSGEKNSLIIWLCSILLINLMFALSFYKNSRGKYLFGVQREGWTLSWNVLIVLSYTSFSLLFPVFFAQETKTT